jgi:hypothetical protein
MSDNLQDIELITIMADLQSKVKTYPTGLLGKSASSSPE